MAHGDRRLPTPVFQGERRFRVYEEAPGIRPDPRRVSMMSQSNYYLPHLSCVGEGVSWSLECIITRVHTTPGSEGSLRGRLIWAPSGGLNGGFTVGF